MAKVYFNLIKQDLKKLAEVPLKWRSEVKKLLEVN